MKISSFKKFIKEDDSKAIVKTGINSVGVDNTITREILNSRLANVTRAPFLTPYIALGNVARVLAYASIVVPQYTFLDRDEGEVVFDANQFGKTVGIKIDGTPEDEEETDYYVYFSYSMNDDGFYDCFAALVDSEGLEKILDMDDDVMDKVDTHQEIEKMHEDITGGRSFDPGRFNPSPRKSPIETSKERVTRLNRPGYNPPPKTPSRPTTDDRSTREPSSNIPRSDRSTREPSSNVPRSDRSTREPTPAPRNLPPAPRDGEEPSAAVPPMRRSTPAPSTSAPRPSTPAPRPSTPNYPVYKKDSPEAQSFRDAFGAARKSGQKEFEWQGRKYGTQLAKPSTSAPSQTAPKQSAPAPKADDSDNKPDVRLPMAPSDQFGKNKITPTKTYNPNTGETKPIEDEKINERKMTKAEMKERERIVRRLKDKMAGFEKNYDEKAEKVMYATATKMAMEELKVNEAADPDDSFASFSLGSRRGNVSFDKKSNTYFATSLGGTKKVFRNQKQAEKHANLDDREMGDKNEELKGNQHKLDVAEPKGKLTAADFKKLRGEKSVDEVLDTPERKSDYLRAAAKSLRNAPIGSTRETNRSAGIARAQGLIPAKIQPSKKVDEESINERKSSDPKGLAYKVTAASHAANPQWGPADHTQDPKTHFGTAATRSSTLAAVRSIRAQRSQGGFDANNPQHVDAAAKAVHGSPQDYEGKPRGWSQTAMTHSGQSPEQKERRAKLTGPYGSLSEPEKEKDREIVRTVAANMPTKKSK